ncbi:MAG: TonB family protein [Alistipes sp.]|nr:TonB family protein [Alistipes sp.]
MKKIIAILFTSFITMTLSAQAVQTIIIEQKSFRAVQTDALTGVNIDPIGLDYSKRPCARLKVKINRMTKEQIDGIEVKPITNNAVMKCKTAEYDNGLIIELTAKSQTRFYFHHDEFGDSNEVCLDLKADKEYRLDAYLNQLYSVIVNSNVAGADVYIDGIFKGQTSNNFDLTVEDVMIGQHTLTLEYSSLKYEQTIEVNKGSISFRQNVNTQASKPQFVVFAVEPKNAVVMIEGKLYTPEQGTVTAVLESGTYNYTVSVVGYHPQSGTFTVSGQKVEKVISLKADSAYITLTAPDNAEIWVNGVKKGIGSWKGSLNSGAYIFEARKEGHRAGSLSQTVDSKAGTQSYALPAPQPITGAIDIISTPAMAEIIIDGKAVGRTPISLSDILIGNHNITLAKSGYNSYSQTITIVEGQSVTLNATLTEQSKQTQTAPAPKPQTTAPVKDSSPTFTATEQMPQFMGGDLRSFQIWVSQRLVYPPIAQENGIQGTVVVQFIVEKDGSLSNIKVLRSPDNSLSKEAVRVVSSSPKWTPGRQNGEAVRVQYRIPIGFKLQ